MLRITYCFNLATLRNSYYRKIHARLKLFILLVYNFRNELAIFNSCCHIFQKNSIGIECEHSRGSLMFFLA